jgi:hypothetical protein
MFLDKDHEDYHHDKGDIGCPPGDEDCPLIKAV